MNKNEVFPEQEAPEKNTDNAFVQVGKDGHPVIPQTADATKENKSDQSQSTQSEE